jgi:peptidylprolyl isomerase
MRRRVIAAVTLAVALVGCSSTVSGHGTGAPSSTAGGPSSTATGEPTSEPTGTPSSSASADTVTFHGVTVSGASNLDGAPDVTSRQAETVDQLLYLDLVTGSGPAATPDASVTVQYVGVLYSDGTKFDSSWDRGQPAQFSLNQVVTGFAAAIGGTSGVPPMRVGGRRLMILPPDLAYGSQGQGPVPGNATLVFVVDLKAVS